MNHALADGILLLHALFVGVVAIGGFLIAAGGWRGWRWVRNPWFRFIHLGMIVFVAVESLAGIPCPLTVWESALRNSAGETGYGEEGFIAGWLGKLIYHDWPQWVFTALYVSYALLVLGLFYWVPVRPRRTEGKTLS